jgi:lantibiotic modifying enzyme
MAAFDWGLKELLTLAKSDGTMETISNPRFLKRSAAALAQLQRAISCEELNAKALIGLLPTSFDCSGHVGTPVERIILEPISIDDDSVEIPVDDNDDIDIQISKRG